MYFSKNTSLLALEKITKFFKISFSIIATRFFRVRCSSISTPKKLTELICTISLLLINKEQSLDEILSFLWISGKEYI